MILISIAIAAGIVFLLLLIGVLWAIFSRRDDHPAEEYVDQEGEEDSLHHRPSSLLEHINAATRNTIIGGAIFQNGEKNISPEPTDGTHIGEDEDGMGTGEAYNDPDGEGRVARARCKFDVLGWLCNPLTSWTCADSFVPSGDGELQLSEGAQVVVLDDRDPAYVVLPLLHIFRLIDSSAAGGSSGTRQRAMKVSFPPHTSTKHLFLFYYPYPLSCRRKSLCPFYSFCPGTLGVHVLSKH